MNIARIVFGIIYLGGALANITLTVFNSPQSYSGFADQALIPFYRDAWAALVIPNMTLFISLLIVAEITLGLLFLLRRRFLTIALAGGTLFCLGTAPFSLQTLGINLPLGLLQAFLLWRESRWRGARPARAS